MTKANGLYGHVRSNEIRSFKMFAGFIVSFQLLAIAILAWPILFFDSSYFPLINPLGYLGKYGLLIFILELLLFLVQFLAVTSIVESTTEFQYCYELDEKRLHRIVQNLSILAGIPKPKIAIIRSDARNAFACGTSPTDAVVVVTTGLLEIMDDNELSAVMAHEIVHIRNGDILLMACANIFVSNIRFFEKLNIFRVQNKGCLAAMLLLPPVLILVMLQRMVGTLGRSIGNWSRLKISVSRELIADAEAIRLTQNPGAFISALRKIEGKSHLMLSDDIIESMMIDGPSSGTEATHPSIADRIAALVELTGAEALSAWTGKDTRPIEDILKHHASSFGRKGLRNSPARPEAFLSDKIAHNDFSFTDEKWYEKEIGRKPKIYAASAVFLFTGIGTFPIGLGWLILPLFIMSGAYLLAQLYDFIKDNK